MPIILKFLLSVLAVNNRGGHTTTLTPCVERILGRRTAQVNPDLRCRRPSRIQGFIYPHNHFQRGVLVATLGDEREKSPTANNRGAGLP